MWDAFIHLCDTGVAIKTSNIFKPSSYILKSISDFQYSRQPSANIPDTSSRGSSGDSTSPQSRTKPQANTDPFTTSTRHNLQLSYEKMKHSSRPPTKNAHDLPPRTTASSDPGTGPKLPGLVASLSQDPRLRTAKDDRGTTLAYSNLKAPKPSTRKTRTTGMESTGTPTRIQQSLPPNVQDFRLIDRASVLHAEQPGLSASTAGHKRTISGQLAHGPSQESSSDGAGTRRSVRLMSRFNTANTSTLKKKIRGEFRVPKAPILKRSTSIVSQVESNRTDAETSESLADSLDILPSKINLTPVDANFTSSERFEAIHSLLSLCAKFGEGYYLLSRFRCRDALHIFETIPSLQRETAWVLSHKARAHFEQANYAEAARIFAKARSLTPLRMEDMDIYSTSLWHLKRDVDLAFLSYELIELDYLSAQAWIAVGNSFSLQGDHLSAIKCFRRATQLEPKLAYAFTLEGHEHLSNEEYDKEIHAFRKSATAMRRHYNGWYGLGIAHLKLGKFEMAETYFRIATKINPTNAVLIGCIGMVSCI